jgi:hypothetical protein
MANTFKNQLQAAVGTSPATIYTAGANVSTTVIGMTIANILNTTITANVILNSGGSDYYMVKMAEIEPGNSLITIGGEQKLVMRANDVLKVSTSNASAADVIVSLLEIT